MASTAPLQLDSTPRSETSHVRLDFDMGHDGADAFSSHTQRQLLAAYENEGGASGAAGARWAAATATATAAAATSVGRPPRDTIVNGVRVRRRAAGARTAAEAGALRIHPAHPLRRGGGGPGDGPGGAHGGAQSARSVGGFSSAGHSSASRQSAGIAPVASSPAASTACTTARR
jgi:hypothetical protein